MKTISRFGLLFVGASAIPALAVSGCGDDGVTTGDEESVIAGHDDPFVEVVLKGGCSVKNEQTGKSFKTEGTDGACPTTVKDVLAVLEADNAGGSEIYLVSELGDRPAEDVGYRFVIAQKTSLKDAKNSDLFFSTLGSVDGISQGFLEVMAFSPQKQAYNYYALAKGKWEFKGDGAQAELDPTTGEPAFECLGCHKAGTPIMKELQDGWSNWFSTWFTPTDPKSKDETFKALFDKKRRADDLEDRVIEGTRAHNKGLVERALEEEELAPLLKRMLCEVDTGNLIGVHSKSSSRFGEVSTFSSGFPSSYLLHQLFKTPSGGSGAQGGYDDVLGMTLSLSSVNVPADSYKKAITEAKQKIGDELGDAMFPWFGPEKGYADNDVVQQLFAKGLLDKDLLADVLMTDFTVPVFSEIRCGLAETLPEKGADADAVRKAWIENLEGSELRGAAGVEARLRHAEDRVAAPARVHRALRAGGRVAVPPAHRRAGQPARRAAPQRGDVRDRAADGAVPRRERRDRRQHRQRRHHRDRDQQQQHRRGRRHHHQQQREQRRGWEQRRHDHEPVVDDDRGRRRLRPRRVRLRRQAGGGLLGLRGRRLRGGRVLLQLRVGRDLRRERGLEPGLLLQLSEPSRVLPRAGRSPVRPLRFPTPR
jgi:hypothetical protein